MPEQEGNRKNWRLDGELRVKVSIDCIVDKNFSRADSRCSRTHLISSRILIDWQMSRRDSQGGPKWQRLWIVWECFRSHRSRVRRSRVHRSRVHRSSIVVRRRGFRLVTSSMRIFCLSRWHNSRPFSRYEIVSKHDAHWMKFEKQRFNSCWGWYGCFTGFDKMQKRRGLRSHNVGEISDVTG